MNEEELRPEIWDIATARAAKCVRGNRRISGIDQGEIVDNIALTLYPQQDEILGLLADGKADDAEAIIRNAVRKTENAAVCETRKAIRDLVPFQVRKAKERDKSAAGGNGIVTPGKKDAVDEAYTSLARDMMLWRHRWCDDARVNSCVRFTLKNLPSIDRQIGFLYLEEESWQKVAQRLGLSEGDFRRKHLPRFKANFAAVWAQVW